jgi:hypothetical protein
MLDLILLVSALALPAQGDAKPAKTEYTPEQLAEGAIREIISAQAVHKQTSPRVGYACSLERLVEAQLLLDTWLAGKRVEGYSFRVWCEPSSTPQASYRASGVPSKKTKGATLTVCTDQTNVPRTIDGDVAACFTKGAPPADK